MSSQRIDMTLILDLIGPPRLLGARKRFEMRFGSATVGRSPEADWVIPDLNRMISRRHLRIDASGGDFTLTDTSSNGVYVNANVVPVGYGASVKLQNGDRIRVGEAEIAVAIADVDGVAAEGPPRRAAAPEPTAPPNARRDPLGGPFASSSSSSATAERSGGPEIIDANWMIEPTRLPLPPQGAERDPPFRQAGQGTSLPVAPASLLALVDRHPGLTVRRLADAVDGAMQAMAPSIREDLYERIDQLMRPQT